MRSLTLGVLIMLALTPKCYSQETPPLNVAEWASAREILEGAKAFVGSGWAQGNSDPNSMPRVVCLSTAMEASFLEKHKTIVDFEYAKLALNKAIDAPAVLPTSKDDPLSVPYWGRFYVYWNDTPGRTKEQVVAALDKAIGYATSQHELAVKENRTEADLEKYDQAAIQRLKLPTQ